MLKESNPSQSATSEANQSDRVLASEERSAERHRRGENRGEPQINLPKAASTAAGARERLSGGTHALRNSGSPWALRRSQLVFTRS